jgi:hypothetical protein
MLLATGCSFGDFDGLEPSGGKKQVEVNKKTQALTKDTTTTSVVVVDSKDTALRPNTTRGGCTEQQFNDGCAQFGRGHVLFCDCGTDMGGEFGNLKPNKAGACTEQQLQAGCYDMSKGHVRVCDCPMGDTGDGNN